MQDDENKTELIICILLTALFAFVVGRSAGFGDPLGIIFLSFLISFFVQSLIKNSVNGEIRHGKIINIAGVVLGMIAARIYEQRWISVEFVAYVLIGSVFAMIYLHYAVQMIPKIYKEIRAVIIGINNFIDKIIK